MPGLPSARGFPRRLKTVALYVPHLLVFASPCVFCFIFLTAFYSAKGTEDGLVV